MEREEVAGVRNTVAGVRPANPIVVTRTQAAADAVHVRRLFERHVQDEFKTIRRGRLVLVAVLDSGSRKA